jgi:hypothetical protein
MINAKSVRRVATPAVSIAAVLLVVFVWNVARADKSVDEGQHAHEASVQYTANPVLVTGTSPDRGVAAAVDASYEESPRQLALDECTEARPRMEALATLARKRVQELGSAELSALLDSRLAESRAWFDAGCPAHSVLGIYPAKDGSGTKNIFLDFPGRP